MSLVAWLSVFVYLMMISDEVKKHDKTQRQ